MVHLRPLQIALAVFLYSRGPVITQAAGPLKLKNVDTQRMEKNLRNQIGNRIHAHDEKILQTSRFDSRRMISWAGVLKFLLHPPHPPHPHHKGGGGSGGSSSGGSSSGSSSGSSVASATSDSSSSGGSSSGGSTGAATGASTSETGDIGTGSKMSEFVHSSTTITMFVVAAAAAATAMAAVVMGRRQKTVVATHPLRGGLNRRIALFSNFANKPSASMNRPERLVEMTTKGTESDYVAV